jgi:hypothetical protein
MNLNNIDYFFCEFESATDGETDTNFFKERDFLGGWTVSNRHPTLGFKRKSSNLILPESTISSIDINGLRLIIESTIKNFATDKNVLFLSGGKDSSTLAYIFKKLDIPFIPVSLYSAKSQTTEVNIVKQLEKELNIEVVYYRIDTIPKHNFQYWIENPYTAKSIAIKELGLEEYTIFTGEIGTGEMQINQSLQYTAMMGYRPKDLARWHVNVCGSHRKVNSVMNIYNDEIYQECIDFFENRFNQWDRHPDILNRVMFSRLQDEGAFRLFNYGVDDLKWVHPYAENEFIKNCVNMPSEFKGKKNLYREMYPEMTDIAWRYPKSGLGIPTM